MRCSLVVRFETFPFFDADILFTIKQFVVVIAFSFFSGIYSNRNLCGKTMVAWRLKISDDSSLIGKNAEASASSRWRFSRILIMYFS